MFLLKECPHTLDLFVAASKAVVERSMKISGQKLFSNSEPSSMVVPGTRVCIVSFDASWHRRGHFSNQGFAGAIDSFTGKVSDYALYDRVCSMCSKWDEDRKLQNPDEFAEFGKTPQNLHFNLLGELESNGNVSFIVVLEQVHSQTPAGLWDLHC